MTLKLNWCQVYFIFKEILESIDEHLTAGLVSNDVRWLNYMLGNTINGVTYSGSRARTTGAP